MSSLAPVRLATGIVATALVGTLALAARSMRPTPTLPVLGHVPSFRLIDQRGAPFATESMLGHVSIVDFIFTRCTSSCPRLTARMAQLRKLLGSSSGDVRLVSFSVDPDDDTPPVLAAYAAKVGAEAPQWTFVTGGADDVARAVVLGFKMSAAKIVNEAGDEDVTHGDWLVLVDRTGALRGYYPTEERAEFQALVDDAVRLDREKPRTAAP